MKKDRIMMMVMAIIKKIQVFYQCYEWVVIANDAEHFQYM